MTRVVIIGGGFAGLAAARALRSLGPRVECTLVDRKGAFDFLPMLPDVLSGRIEPRLLQYDLSRLGAKLGFTFLHAEATGIDLAARRICLVPGAIRGNKAEGPGPKAEGRNDASDANGSGLAFDFLIIASGAVTNFYGRDDLRERAFVVDSVEDAARLAAAARASDFDAAVIVGGGYTGIEVATSLRRRFVRHPSPLEGDRPGEGRRAKRVLIVEQAPGLVGAVDPWMHHYVARNLRAMGVDFALNTTLKDLRGRDARLADGRVVANALVVWSAGVRAGDLLGGVDAPKGKQGRLVVDEFLRLNDCCFVAGDAACVMHRGRPMRMAVQIALDQGAVAGANVAGAILGRPPRSYRPVDLGWLVPMANGRSCGKALGFPVRGRVATLLHYAMCVARSIGPARRLRMVKQLLERRG